MPDRKMRLKSQDVLILLKIIAARGKNWRIIDIAYELNISPSEVSVGLERLRQCDLLNNKKKEPNIKNVEECIMALKYFFPPQIGKTTKGLPTAKSILNNNVQFSINSNYIWSYEFGETMGISISPLYESVPEAVLKDKKLYHLLSLLDVIRLGNEKERCMAMQELKRSL